jgi:CheY-like chemotaxis protein
VLLDIRMPGIDGIEVARRIRSREQKRSEAPVPIIAITADADAITLEACRAAGIDVVLTKPIIPEQLGAAIAKLDGNNLSDSALTGLLLNVQALKLLGSDPEHIRQYREMLQKDVDDEILSLQTALERDDRAAFGLSAHTLKGLCGQLENSGPSECAAWLQQNAQSASTEQLRQVLKNLLSMCQCRQGNEPLKDSR